MSGSPHLEVDTLERPAEPVAAATVVVERPSATRNQRIALLIGLLVVLWLVLTLFASVLLPFVAAAVSA